MALPPLLRSPRSTLRLIVCRLPLARTVAVQAAVDISWNRAVYRFEAFLQEWEPAVHWPVQLGVETREDKHCLCCQGARFRSMYVCAFRFW